MRIEKINLKNKTKTTEELKKKKLLLYTVFPNG